MIGKLRSRWKPLLGMEGHLIIRNQKREPLRGGDVWSDSIFCVQQMIDALQKLAEMQTLHALL